jgi:hypothetical protein
MRIARMGSDAEVWAFFTWLMLIWLNEYFGSTFEK